MVKLQVIQMHATLFCQSPLFRDRYLGIQGLFCIFLPPQINIQLCLHSLQKSSIILGESCKSFFRSYFFSPFSWIFFAFLRILVQDENIIFPQSLANSTIVANLTRFSGEKVVVCHITVLLSIVSKTPIWLLRANIVRVLASHIQQLYYVRLALSRCRTVKNSEISLFLHFSQNCI